MSSSKIALSRDAEQDLAELFDYIALDSGVDRAELVLRRIESTLQLLAEWPRSGRLHPELDGAPRIFSVWPWLIVYEPGPNGEGIYVWRITDGRRDLPRIVQKPSQRP
jgi:plasmid stabilization system protein ParE